MQFEAERAAVAQAARRLAAEGLVLGTAGNVSARAGELVAVTPTGANLADLHDPAEIALIDIEGNRVEGELAPTSEIALHLGIYSRYQAGAVVHTHAPVATALACVLDEVPVVHYGMLAFGGSVRVAPYATFGTQEVADLTLNALDGRTVALMANHGAIAYGNDPDHAVEQSLLLEWACTVYWRAAQLGAPNVLGAEQQRAVVQAAIDRSYGATGK